MKTSKLRILSLTFPFVLLVLIGTISSSLLSQHSDPTIPTEEELTLQTNCLDCHADQVTQMTGSPHAVIPDNNRAKVSCLSCHREGAQEHVDDPYGGNIASPAKATPAMQQADCGRCHLAHIELDNIGFDPHLTAAVACSDCHTIHSSTPQLTKDPDMEFCGKCHSSTNLRFQHRSTHMLTSGGMNCISCHSFTGSGDAAAAGTDTYRCMNCHAEESGPFLHEHAGVAGFATGSESCIGCHEPHGSSNTAMLTRTGNQLCQQCHVTPLGHRTAHNGVALTADCMDCHSAVHGSDEFRNLISSDMAARVNGGPASCYCHEVRN